MAQKQKPKADKKVAYKRPTKAVPAKPTYEQLLAARREAEVAQENIKVAVRRLRREKSFYGDFTQRDHLIAEATEQLTVAREEASEARLRFDKLSMEAKP